MDGTTAIDQLEWAILRLQGAIDILETLDGLEQELADLKSTRFDLLAQLHELNSIEA